MQAKNGLENYAFSMKNAVSEAATQGKLDDSDKKTVNDEVDKVVQWLHANQEAAKDEYEHKQKDLEAVCAPIMQKMYSQGGAAGGMPGGMPDMSGMGGAGAGAPGAGSAPSAGPKVEEVD